MFKLDDHPINIIYRVLSPSKEPVLCGDHIGNGTFYQLESYPLEPMKIIFNLAITSQNGPGGSKPVDASTPFPSSFDVDYIRFWKRTEAVFDVYPNPAGDKLIVSSGQTTITNLKICNLQGQKVFEYKYNNTKADMDISMIPEGIYVLELFYDGGSQKKKIVKVGKN